jgi:hypothetical protein
MFSLLRKTRIVYDPRDHWTVFLHGRQYFPPYLRQHLFIVPGGVRHQMMKRLVHATNVVRRQARCHRLDTLTFTR